MTLATRQTRWRAVCDRREAMSADAERANRPDPLTAVALAESPRLREMRADIAARVRPVCPDMPAAEFDALVERMARAAYRWETNIGREPTR